MTTGKAYVVHCSTGCSCCSNENHYRGPFPSHEAADVAVEKYRELRILASQYSPRGEYRVEEFDCEFLPDGRIIIERTVFDDFSDAEISRTWDA